MPAIYWGACTKLGSELSCVLGVYVLSVSTILIFGIVQCGNFCFSFYQYNVLWYSVYWSKIAMNVNLSKNKTLRNCTFFLPTLHLIVPVHSSMMGISHAWKLVLVSIVAVLFACLYYIHYCYTLHTSYDLHIEPLIL